MNNEKLIWTLFKLDRKDFNKANRKIEKILQEVYASGRKDGIKTEKARLLAPLK